MAQQFLDEVALLQVGLGGLAVWSFLMALALFTLGLAGLGISLYPYVVPRALTIWDPWFSKLVQMPEAVGTARPDDRASSNAFNSSVTMMESASGIMEAVPVE